MKIEVVIDDSELFSKLQEFVLQHKITFNSKPWLSNFPKENIRQCIILNNNFEIIGCFNYYYFKKYIFKFAITPPFSPNIDLFFLNPALSVVGRNSFNKEVITAIAEYFCDVKVDLVSLHLPISSIDTQPFFWKGFRTNVRYSYIIDLKQSEEVLLGNLATEKRKSLNRGEKDNLLVVMSEDYELVYSLVVKSLERNSVAKNLKTLKSILLTYANKNNCIAFVAYINGKPSGATFCAIDNTKAYYLFGGFESKNKHHGAGVSCMWQSILKAKELGLEQFDFEGSMNPSIERYFREFGGIITPYFSVEKGKWLLNSIFNLLR